MVTTQWSQPLRCSSISAFTVVVTRSSSRSSNIAINSVHVTSHHHPFCSCGSNGSAVPATAAVLVASATSRPGHSVPNSLRSLLSRDLLHRAAQTPRGSRAAAPESSSVKCRPAPIGRTASLDQGPNRPDRAAWSLLRSPHPHRSKPYDRYAVYASASATHSPQSAPARYKTSNSPETGPTSRTPLKRRPVPRLPHLRGSG